ncbi:hypothetical protein HYW75_00815 [Candidatus Pacearchaeota archaeon]|nr:hypothetical protein [Candidatus Pacearchaeota archaeon]
MKNKKGFEFSFNWIFAVIVGAVIMFLAIYGTTQLVKQERKISDTEAGKQLGIILNPLETGIESGKISKITFPLETRVFNKCLSSGGSAGERAFGIQEISVSTKSGIGKDWENPGIPSSFYNKYIFSSSTIEGKELNIFSKPFYMPFEIADALYITPRREEYCFVNPPIDIEDEIIKLKPQNINVSIDNKYCKKGAIIVCFGKSGCDIDVNLEARSVKKDGQRIYFEDDEENVLLYGAIFSDRGIYECQIKRLMKRASELASLYEAKSISLGPRGCSSGLEQEMAQYANITKNLNKTEDLTEIKILSDEIRRRNEALLCKLF